jgi:predicted dehydrogenase
LSAEIGVAFVGCAHPHLPPRRDLLAAEPDVRLVGCFDPDPRLTKIVHERYGLRVFASVSELLDQPGVQLALVEGWDRDNPVYVGEALKRGQAVLLEKPGARNLDEMRALVAAVRATPVPFQMAFMLAHSPAISEAQRILDARVLGAITLARFHIPGPVGATREPALSLPDDLGGIFYADGSHAVHLIIRLLGLPRSATAMLLRLPAGRPVLAKDYIRDAYTQETVEMPFGGSVHEDAGAAILDYPDKLVTVDMTGWGARPWVEGWAIEFHGTEGTLQVGLQPPWYRLYLRQPQAGYAAGWHSWEGAGVSGGANSLVVDANYRAEMQELLRRVRNWDTSPEPWLDEAHAVATVLDAIFRSARDGKATRVADVRGNGS